MLSSPIITVFVSKFANLLKCSRLPKKKKLDIKSFNFISLSLRFYIYREGEEIYKNLQHFHPSHIYQLLKAKVYTYVLWRGIISYMHCNVLCLNRLDRYLFHFVIISVAQLLHNLCESVRLTDHIKYYPPKFLKFKKFSNGLSYLVFY